jgi:hypothetical protein
VSQAESDAQVLDGKPLHADEQPATASRPANPALDGAVEVLPASHVEIAHAEVRMVRDLQSLPQGGEQVLVDVVENPGLDGEPFLLGKSFVCGDGFSLFSAMKQDTN